jgi:GH15 family glucan-1,4-alpha-glucosidase
MPYQPIEDYGVVGNLRTTALAGKNGSIDWFCFPHFDSPSVFGAILDYRKGGYFRIAPTIDEITRKQVYWPDTNVLVTRFLSTDGVGEIIDYMPVGESNEQPYRGLIRRVKVARGSMRFRLECVPAFNYGRDQHTVEIIAEGARFSSPNLRLGLASSIPLEKLSDNGVAGEFSLDEGQTQSFELHGLGDREQIGLPEPKAKSCFMTPFVSGAHGSPNVPTAAAGAKRCIAQRWF